MPIEFSCRAAYRSPDRNAFNACGTEGAKSPGNIPRVYGMLNAEKLALRKAGMYTLDGMFSGADSHKYGVSQSSGVVQVAAADKQWSGNYAKDVDVYPYEVYPKNNIEDRHPSILDPTSSTLVRNPYL